MKSYHKKLIDWWKFKSGKKKTKKENLFFPNYAIDKDKIVDLIDETVNTVDSKQLKIRE